MTAAEGGGWFDVPGTPGAMARALVPQGGAIGIYLLEMPAGVESVVHEHSQMEALFVLTGSGVFRGPTPEDARELVMDVAVVVPPNTPHSICAGRGGLWLLSIAVPDWMSPAGPTREAGGEAARLATLAEIGRAMVERHRDPVLQALHVGAGAIAIGATQEELDGLARRGF